MPGPMRRVRFTLPAAMTGIIVALVALGLAAGVIHLREVHGQDKRYISRLTNEMRVVCLGRFLMNVPKDATVELFGMRIHGFDVDVINETRDSFDQSLAARENEIKAQADKFGGDRNLESVEEINGPRGLVGKLFVHSRKITEGTRARGLELERYRNEGIATEAWMHVSGTSFVLSADYYDPDQIDNLPQIASKLIPNQNNELLDQSGFCIDQAYFSDPLSPEQGEQLSVALGLPGQPDVEITLNMIAGIKRDPDGLFKRSHDAKAGLSLSDKLRLSTLRAARREVGGVPGEEVIWRAKEKNGATVYSFWWEANGSEDNVFQPQISFRMSTGNGPNGPVPSSLSKTTALVLWDAMCASLRLRPTAPKPTATQTRGIHDK